MKMAKLAQFLKRNSILILTLVGVLFGALLGSVLKIFNPSVATREIIGFPGELFFRALQMLILPSIIFSLIAGAASLNIKENGKITLRTFVYFLLTSLFSTFLGVLFVVTIHPGTTEIKDEWLQVLPSVGSQKIKANTILDNMMDLGRNIVPDNMFTALFEITDTINEKIPINETVFIEVKRISKRPGTNLLGIITLSLMVGCVLSTLKEQAFVLIQFIKLCDKVITKLVRVVIWFMPVGVASIICAKILEVPNIGNLMSLMALFIATVAAGLFTYQLIFLQLFYFLVIHENPFHFYIQMLPAAMTGFAVQSSSIALPVTLQCLDEKTKIDTRISRFVVPLGITINMDGTALFVTVASIFIAQINNISLTFVDYLTVCLTATAVSIATATVPSASLTTMFIILNAIGVPTSDIGLLFSVDWFLDRLRTTNNVLGDCYAAAIVQHLSKKELTQMDHCVSTTEATEAQNLELEEIELNN